LDEIIKSRFKVRTDVFDEESIPSHFVMKELVSKIMTNIISRSFEFNISYHSDKGIPIDRQVFLSIIEPFIKLVVRDKSSPCKITMEYKGIPNSHEAMKMFGPGLHKIVTEYFVKWASTVFSYHIGQDDKRKLEEDQDHLLGASARQYYEIFSRSLSDYLKLIQFS
jgi:hypothetical protein